jgi:hypothetical protein
MGIAIGISVSISTTQSSGAAPAPAVDNLLLEGSDDFLLESGDLLKLEA